MPKQDKRSEQEKMVQFLQNLLAIELWRSGLQQAEIGRRIGVAKATVNKMLKGVQREIVVTMVKE